MTYEPDTNGGYEVTFVCDFTTYQVWVQDEAGAIAIEQLIDDRNYWEKSRLNVEDIIEDVMRRLGRI